MIGLAWATIKRTSKDEMEEADLGRENEHQDKKEREFQCTMATPEKCQHTQQIYAVSKTYTHLSNCICVRLTNCKNTKFISELYHLANAPPDFSLETFLLGNKIIQLNFIFDN